MKTILLPFHDEDAAVFALRGAALMARRFGSYVEGLFVAETAHLQIGGVVPVPAEYLSDYTRQWRERADKTRTRFCQAARENGLTLGEMESEEQGPIAGWREIEGDEATVIGEYGRLFDIIAVGRSRLASSRWRETCEAALFESGRPVLVVADDPPSTIGDVVAIAWNGSTESARTIALAKPLLLAASTVIVVTVEGGMVGGPSGRDVAAHMQRNGIAAHAVSIQPGSSSTGEAFIGEAVHLGADLLLKGAYTRSRLRQYMFGGATEHVLRNAPVPVLMAH
ncbi:MAG: universal stress protein [Rhodospirillales bacterium]|nr:universal stress protein [Rhodospirillales bacterium]